MLSSIAFGNYEGCCAVESVAEIFHRDPRRFMTTLRKLADKGYVQIEGETHPLIYPTMAALMKHDPRLSERKALEILRRIKAAP